MKKTLLENKEVLFTGILPFPSTMFLHPLGAKGNN